MMSGSSENVNPSAPQDPPRRKFYFKKRDPAEVAKLEAEKKPSNRSDTARSQSVTMQNPFGSAKPREEVIAKRTGKDEATIVAEAAKEYQVKVRLNPEQYAQKQAHLQEIAALKETLATEPENAEDVQRNIREKEAELASMLKGFEELLIEKAKAGELPRPARRMPPTGVSAADSEESGGYGGPRGGFGSGGGGGGGGSFGSGGGAPADDFGAGYGTDNRRGGGYQRRGRYQSNREQGRYGGDGVGGGGGGYEEPGSFEQSVGFSGYRDRWGANRRQGGFGGAKGGGSGGSSGPPPRHGGGDVPRGEDRYPMGATDDYRPLAERH